jgi:hypothetical protein
MICKKNLNDLFFSHCSKHFQIFKVLISFTKNKDQWIKTEMKNHFIKGKLKNEKWKMKTKQY